MTTESTLEPQNEGLRKQSSAATPSQEFEALKAHLEAKKTLR
jgi:hypothetical protein